MRASSGSPGSGNGSVLSQNGSERKRESAAMRLTRCVVPERGRPTTMMGAGRSMSSISGCRRHRSSSSKRLLSRRTVRWWIDNRPSWFSPVSASTASIITCSRAMKSSRPKSSRPVRVRAASSNASTSKVTSIVRSYSSAPRCASL